MNDAGHPADPLQDALLAARLFLIAPRQLGGLSLRGFGPARDCLVTALQDAMSLRRLPGHIDDERLLGGVDLAASLASGSAVIQRGLLEEAQGGALLVPMAERLDDALAGRLVQAFDDGSEIGLVLLDDSTSADEAPPVSLLERMPFLCDLTAVERLPVEEIKLTESGDLARVDPLADSDLQALAATGSALGVQSVRALVFAGQAALAHAALEKRTQVNEPDLNAAVRLVLAPRATQLPPAEETPPDDV
ncbi:MAG: magnesium chelatase, partial [Pseudomonadota bacterium]